MRVKNEFVQKVTSFFFPTLCKCETTLGVVCFPYDSLITSSDWFQKNDVVGL